MQMHVSVRPCIFLDKNTADLREWGAISSETCRDLCVIEKTTTKQQKSTTCMLQGLIDNDKVARHLLTGFV